MIVVNSNYSLFVSPQLDFPQLQYWAKNSHWLSYKLWTCSKVMIVDESRWELLRVCDQTVSDSHQLPWTLITVWLRLYCLWADLAALAQAGIPDECRSLVFTGGRTCLLKQGTVGAFLLFPPCVWPWKWRVGSPSHEPFSVPGWYIEIASHGLIARVSRHLTPCTMQLFTGLKICKPCSVVCEKNKIHCRYNIQRPICSIQLLAEAILFTEVTIY